MIVLYLLLAAIAYLVFRYYQVQSRNEYKWAVIDNYGRIDTTYAFTTYATCIAGIEQRIIEDRINGDYKTYRIINMNK